jgi:hypothetical protein
MVHNSSRSAALEAPTRPVFQIWVLNLSNTNTLPSVVKPQNNMIQPPLREAIVPYKVKTHVLAKR